MHSSKWIVRLTRGDEWLSPLDIDDADEQNYGTDEDSDDDDNSDARYCWNKLQITQIIGQILLTMAYGNRHEEYASTLIFE